MKGRDLPSYIHRRKRDGKLFFGIANLFGVSWLSKCFR